MNWDLTTSPENQNSNKKCKKTKAIDLNKIALPDTLQKILAYASIILLFGFILLNSTDNLSYNLILDEKSKLASALLSTLGISLVTLTLSLIGGFLFFLSMKSHNTFLRTLSIVIREVVMGTPLLVMVFLVVYVLGIAIGVNNKLVLSILALSVYMIPYVANTYESAIAVIDEDQYTVMNLYHFTAYQRYRYIILPQMIKPLIPGMLNNLSSIIKGSALLKIVSISEISYVITVISNKNYASIEGYLIMWVMYLIITIPLSIVATILGKRLTK
jgi:His/Glu/Gln/Arg/opine family amino acid ABC transporter permease subunit